MSKLARQAILGFAQLFVVMAIALFGPAWTLDYWQAWVFMLVFFGSAAAITWYLRKNDPRLLERRVNAGPAAEQATLQKLIQAVAALAFVGCLVVPALDRRFMWSLVPFAIVIAGDLLVAFGFFVVFVVFRENTYTAATIEVASDQKVISTGPYAIVRHPMYAGALVLLCGTPLALGSWWGLLLMIPMTLVIALRLLDEEQFLARNLPGYTEYCRRLRFRLIPYIWLLGCVALLAGCGLLQPTPGEQSPTQPVAPQIAYVGADDQIYTADADGSNARQVTSQITGLSADQGWAYRWPTYSQDGRRLAFAGYRTGASQLQSAAVLTADLGQTSTTAILESAGMATIYLYWSPDNRHLAALLQHGNDLELHLLDATGQEQPRQLAVGQPLYWSWAPDGSTLAVHIGGAAAAGGNAWVGLLHLGVDGTREERFADAPGDFRAPAWSASGAKLAYVSLGGGASLLSVRDSGGQVMRITSSTQDVAFDWSPTGDWLAFAEGDPSRPGLYRGLEVAHADGSDRHRLSQDPLVAFFWSPDGARLALVGVDTGARALTWTVVSADGKSKRPLSGSFVPSGDFGFQLPFFDQYAQSTSIWSSDSRRIVYGADTTSGGRFSNSTQTEGVMVVDVDSQTTASAVANGGLGVWSPAAKSRAR